MRVVVYGAILATPLGWALWPRGKDLYDGRHDRGENGLWLQHGWLGDNGWFAETGKTLEQRTLMRSPERVAELASLLDRHGIRDVFPHLCPANPDGSVMPVDAKATERFLDALPGRRVMPWIGGILDVHVHPSKPQWRKKFVASAAALCAEHARLAGVHVNVEPCPSGDAGFLDLLSELRAALPSEAVLSVAAYPPPTFLHPFEDVHWDEAYYRRVARLADQMVPMMYDTSLRTRMLYRRIMAEWTREVLAWSEGTPALLGLPAYDDADTGYHDPEIENLVEGLAGVHEALASHDALPDAYRGVAIYSDWEMDESEWATLRDGFLK